ncbi:MAG: glycosyltransferase family 4 protein, partial [Planctomycetaceae bacterium]|nr:glycosyltransferase family 4 protein [Planctomycetaceae bacterium]
LLQAPSCKRCSAGSRIVTKALVSVVCSRYENLPLAVLETMALGCPLVAARVGGIPEVLDGHANRLLHCAGNSDNLAAQIIALLNDPERSAQLGIQAAIDSEQRLPLKSWLRG